MNHLFCQDFSPYSKDLKNMCDLLSVGCRLQGLNKCETLTSHGSGRHKSYYFPEQTQVSTLTIDLEIDDLTINGLSKSKFKIKLFLKIISILICSSEVYNKISARARSFRISPHLSEFSGTSASFSVAASITDLKPSEPINPS